MGLGVLFMADDVESIRRQEIRAGFGETGRATGRRVGC